MTRYTPVPGTLALPLAKCKKLLRDNALSYKPENIVVSNGAKQSLFNALSAILNPGDEVLIPSPCWVSYPEMVRMAWGEPVYVKTREEEEFCLAAALEGHHAQNQGADPQFAQQPQWLRVSGKAAAGNRGSGREARLLCDFR